MNKIRLHVIFSLRRLRGNAILAILMGASIGVLISASTTTLLLLTAMVPGPERQASTQLVALQSENWGMKKKEWSLETDRICDGKSAGLIRLLL